MKLSDELRSVARSLKEDWEFPAALYEAADELDRLTAALPKTADGVTIVPGMEVWWLEWKHGPMGPYKVGGFGDGYGHGSGYGSGSGSGSGSGDGDGYGSG